MIHSRAIDQGNFELNVEFFVIDGLIVNAVFANSD